MTDDTLNLYIDGRLSPDEARRVEHHLERDAALRTRLDGLLAVRAAVQSAFAGPDDLPGFDEVWGGVEARLDAEAAAEAVAPSAAEAWWSWLFRPAFAMAAGAAMVAVIVAGVWVTNSTGEVAPAGDDPAQVATNVPASTPEPAPGARRELPAENGRRGMFGEEQAKRSLAIVESYDVGKGVVVVSAPTGSARRPLVIWHLVPGEELDGAEEVTQ